MGNDTPAQQDLSNLLAAMRAGGWMVAVHNDYRLNGQRMTFWLFTHPSGGWVKGEGKTDVEALTMCIEQAGLGDTHG